jgi:large subunit ribosomal protein L29
MKKKGKQQVYREMTLDELRERLEEDNKQLVKMKLAHAVSPLENPQKLKDFRKNIARMKTELRNRETEAANTK